MLTGSTGHSIAAAVRWACRLDVQAAKPGNVSVGSPGHGMHAEDFLASAEAIAVPLSEPGWKVGERIAAAIDATWRGVGMNTNLGIVLLAAPLTHAVLTARSGETLEGAVGRVLAGLDADDAVHAFRAIAQANPAGLGHAERLDVHGPVQGSLLEAMREAAHRDTIALQYANGFAEVFALGVPTFLAARDRFQCEERATVACFLAWLGRFPDTHIARKHGAAVAHDVRSEAVRVWAAWSVSEGAAADALLRAWDESLKARHLNPGTSADLTVASLLAARLQCVCEEQFSERDHGSAPQRKVDARDGSARVIEACREARRYHVGAPRSTVFQPRRKEKVNGKDRSGSGG
jgi:triphosphoribosyl-dephospho-CoA synthase